MTFDLHGWLQWAVALVIAFLSWLTQLSLRNSHRLTRLEAKIESIDPEKIADAVARRVNRG